MPRLIAFVLFVLIAPSAPAGFVFDFEVSEGGNSKSVRVPDPAREFGVTLANSPFKCMLKSDEVEANGYRQGRAELWCCIEKPSLSQCSVAFTKCTKEEDGNASLALVEILAGKNDKASKEEIRRAQVNFHCMYLEERDAASLPEEPKAVPAPADSDVLSPESDSESP